jgi:hypothetical protein
MRPLESPTDGKQHLLPMINAVKQRPRHGVREVPADSDYCSKLIIRQTARKKVDLHVAVEKPNPGRTVVLPVQGFKSFQDDFIARRVNSA